MRKKAITKPEFGKIFIVRFVIWLVIYLFVAVYALGEVYNYVYRHEIFEPTCSYMIKMEENAEILSKAEPGSDEYVRSLNSLRTELLLYQMVGYNYAEVQVNDIQMATDEDSAFFWSRYDEGNDWLETFFIEDRSYLEPLNEFLRQNGMKDERQYTDIWYRYERDPLTAGYFPLNDNRFENIKSAYINRETHTFLPGVIKLVNNGKEYEIDCTPADTKGYEYLEYDSENEKQLLPAYRVATDLSSKDICYHSVPGYTLDNDSYYHHEDYGYEFDKSWHIGYSDYRAENALVVAPFSSALIVIIYLAVSAITAIVFAVIKYQKDKTIWEIFDYRIKTTEAMAHDLKTPLSTIMFYLENLEESSKDPDKVLEYKKNINDKIVTMDHMIGEILLFSRSESGSLGLSKEEISLKELITESLKEFPDMETDIKGGDITLATDRKVLGQAIMNLLSNCDRYKEKGSIVDIAISPDTLTLTNKTDRSYDDVDSLKKPFVKGDDSRGNKGTGLGLAVADNNLAILGYKLELSSEQNEFRVIVKLK